jgi:hypothetical protein
MMERSGVPVDASAVLPGWRQDASGVSRGLSEKAGSGGRGFLTRPFTSSHCRLGEGFGLTEAGKRTVGAQKTTPTEVGVPSSLT